MTAGDGDATLHVTDDLPGLLLGELTVPEFARVQHHLRSCETCRDELVSMAIASGALVGAARHVASAPGDPEVRLSPLEEAANSSAGWLEQPATPPGGRHPRARRAPHRHRTFALAGGAVLALLLGLGGGVLLSRAALVTRGPTGPVVAAGRLRGVATPAAVGAAEVLAAGPTRVVHIRAEHLPALRPGHFYEVWLLDPRTDKMLPLGVLPPSGRATFAVPATLTEGYSAVNVSLQPNNGDPAHSATSELQGAIIPSR